MGAGAVRLAAAGVLAVVLSAGVLLGRAWERGAGGGDVALGPGELVDSAGTTEDGAEVRRGGGPNRSGPMRGGGRNPRGDLYDRDLPPLERLAGSMFLGRVSGLDEAQATQLFQAWDSLRDVHDAELRTSWRQHWEGGGYEARYDPLAEEWRPIAERADSLKDLTDAIRGEAGRAYEGTREALDRAQNDAVLDLIRSFLTPEQVLEYDSIRANPPQRGRRSGGGGSNRPGGGGE